MRRGFGISKSKKGTSSKDNYSLRGSIGPILLLYTVYPAMRNKKTARIFFSAGCCRRLILFTVFGWRAQEEFRREPGLLLFVNRSGTDSVTDKRSRVP